MKIILLTTISIGVINFRKKLIEKMLAGGDEIYVVCGDNFFEHKIRDMGCKFYCIPMENRSMNIVSLGRYTRELSRLIEKVIVDSNNDQLEYQKQIVTAHYDLCVWAKKIIDIYGGRKPV